jgi:hypothetical protein
MKKLILFAAICLAAGPAFADSVRTSNIASRGGIANSATVTQTAGAFAFAQVAQGDRVSIHSPDSAPLVTIETGAFVMPYVSGSFNASRGGDVRVYDPIGSVELSSPIP